MLTQLTITVAEDEAALLRQILENLKMVRHLSDLSPRYYYDPHQGDYSFQDMLDIVARFPEGYLWTAADLDNPYFFPPDNAFKIEILHHQLYLIDPSTLHQKILTRISTFLNMYVMTHQLGDVYVAPVSLKIDEATVLKPDILYVSVARRHIVGEKGLTEVPDLVVEVHSPANYKKLREQKKQVYADFGVREYWEIQPSASRIRIETLVQTEDKGWAYALFSEAEGQGQVRSQVLEGFTLSLGQVFPEVEVPAEGAKSLG